MDEENFHVYIPVFLKLRIRSPITLLSNQNIKEYLKWVEKELNKQLEGDGDAVELSLEFKANIRRIK